MNVRRKRFVSHRLRLQRQKDPGGIFAVTKCVQPRRPVLTNKERNLIVSSFRFFVGGGDIEVAAFVVMPDHFHVLVDLLQGHTLPVWMHRLMSFVAAKTTPTLRAFGCCWHEGFYDTGVRTARQFHYLIDYIHDNPVRAGLVAKPEESGRGLFASRMYRRLPAGSRRDGGV